MVINRVNKFSIFQRGVRVGCQWGNKMCTDLCSKMSVSFPRAIVYSFMVHVFTEPGSVLDPADITEQWCG